MLMFHHDCPAIWTLFGVLRNISEKTISEKTKFVLIDFIWRNTS
jgi:hypothetical protein